MKPADLSGSKSFGGEINLMHEVVCTGRKGGIKPAFYLTISRDSGLFRHAEREVEEERKRAEGRRQQLLASLRSKVHKPAGVFRFVPPPFSYRQFVDLPGITDRWVEYDAEHDRAIWVNDADPETHPIRIKLMKGAPADVQLKDGQTVASVRHAMMFLVINCMVSDARLYSQMKFESLPTPNAYFSPVIDECSETVHCIGGGQHYFIDVMTRYRLKESSEKPQSGSPQYTAVICPT